jgi:hypothetical protein
MLTYSIGHFQANKRLVTPFESLMAAEPLSTGARNRPQDQHKRTLNVSLRRYSRADLRICRKRLAFDGQRNLRYYDALPSFCGK